MKRPRLLPITGAVAALALLVGLVLGSSAILAQETTGTPRAGAVASPDVQADVVAFPAHIHSGTCDQLGEVIFPLNDLRPPGAPGTPSADLEAIAAADATPETGTAMIGTPDIGESDDEIAGMATPAVGGAFMVAESTTTVIAPLDAILAEPYVINVHQSAENIDSYIACGEITDTGGLATTFGTPEAGTAQVSTPDAGVVSAGRQVQLILQELNNSGFEGQATLTENPDGTTEVTVQLVQAAAIPSDTGTPVASPSA